MIKLVKEHLPGIGVGAVIVFLIFILITGFRLETATVPKLMSGGPEAMDCIQKQDPNNFSFMVLGDTKCGTATAESILEIIKDEAPAFIVFLGDFSSKPTPYAHRFFIMETKEFAQKFPLLVVPGNHDVDVEGPFTINDFESLYGPAGKSFTLGNNLFVLLNNVEQYNSQGQYIDFLEKTIQSQAVPPARIFVFMHIPPAGLKIPVLSQTPVQSQRFLDTARKYHVNYVFCGDHHGYLKTNLDGVNFVISGGGGDKLRGKLGRFHHAVRIAVASNEISETVILVKKQLETFELLEQNTANYFWPFFVHYKVPVAAMTLIAMSLFFVRHKKQKNSAFFKTNP
jgi:Icc protein